MLIILFGSKDYHNTLGYVINTCPDCGEKRVFTVLQERKKVTIYLIPTVQYSSKQYMACPVCREVFEVDDDIKEELEIKLLSKKELLEMEENGKLEKLLNKGKKPRSTKLKCKICQAPLVKGMKFCPECGGKAA